MKTSHIIAIICSFCFTFSAFAQSTLVTISGQLKDQNDASLLAYVNVILKTEKENTFVVGTVTNEEGRFTLAKVPTGNYRIEFSYLGYKTESNSVFIGSLSEFIDLRTILLKPTFTGT